MGTRITILCDNTVGPLSGTLGEHGFAALVEYDGGALLFDTGGGATLLPNAERMRRELRGVPVVLSHGHRDHTGGLLPLLQHAGGREVHAHPGVFAARYALRKGEPPRAIGMPHDETLFREHGARFVLESGFREIGPGVFLTGEVPRTTVFEQGDGGLFRDDAGQVPDPLPDDQSLVIGTEKGLVLVLGCCHAGIVNTIEHARARTGIADIYAVIGGTHLGFSAAHQLEETVRRLRSYRIRKLCGSHCTGFAGAARLAREFPGAYYPACVGYTLET